MLKRIFTLSLISVALVGCGNSKEAVYDKCLTQTNQTYEKNDLGVKYEFMNGCMAERGYQRVDSYDCVGNLSSNCYVKK